MTAKKSRKKIAPTAPRTTRNMAAFIQEQIPKTMSSDQRVLAALRTLIEKAFDRDEDLPTNLDIAEYTGMPSDTTGRLLRQLEKKKLIVDISHNPLKRLFVPNDPKYIIEDDTNK